MCILSLFFTLFLSFQSYAELSDGLYEKMRINQDNSTIKLAFEKIPLTVINFVDLVEDTKYSNTQINKPFYNGLIFHRAIKNFMIQGSNPKGNGIGAALGYKFIDAITDLTYNRDGILPMVNSGLNINSPQFFITHTVTPDLDGIDTVFNHIEKDIDVVNRIKKENFIRKVEIFHIGEKAKNFQTNEVAFQVQNKKDLAKKYKKIIEFVKDNRPNTKAKNEGHFLQLNHVSSISRSNKGDSITMNLSITLYDDITTYSDGEVT